MFCRHRYILYLVVLAAANFNWIIPTLQLSPLASLFEPKDVADYLLPIAFELAFDRVAKVSTQSIFKRLCPRISAVSFRDEKKQIKKEV